MKTKTQFRPLIASLSLALCAALSGASTADAAERGPYALEPAAEFNSTISVAKEDLDANFFADRIGDGNVYTVEGYITSPNFRSSVVEVFIQDTNNNVGVMVHIPDLLGNYSPATFLPGRRVQVGRGSVRQRDGLRFLQPSSRFFFNLVHGANPVDIAPIPLSIAQLLAAPETYEGAFVVVSNATPQTGATLPASGQEGTFTIADGSTPTRLPVRIFPATDIDGQILAPGSLTLKGIFSQIDPAAIPNGGYELWPRYYSDFTFTPSNYPPAIRIDGPLAYTIAVETTLTVDMHLLDPNVADVLEVAVVSGPAGAVVSKTEARLARLQWTPSNDFLGVRTQIVVSVSDGEKMATQSVSVAVMTLAQAAIVLNETLWDPPPGLDGDANGDGFRDPQSNQDEFIELVNTWTGRVDISGWTLSFATQGAINAFIEFPPGTIMTGNTAVVVFGGGTPTGVFGGAQVFVKAAAGPVLANTPGARQIALFDAGRTEIWSFNYASFGTPDTSATRHPDRVGAFTHHNTLGRLFSPGTRTDGTPFPGSGITNSPPSIIRPGNRAARVGQSVEARISASDPDGDTLAFTMTNAPTSATLTTHGDNTATLSYTGLVADVGRSFSITVTASDRQFSATATFRLDVPEAAYSGLVINEFMADPDVYDTVNQQTIHTDSNRDGVTNATDDEFVEIVNMSGQVVNLLNCTLSDSVTTRVTFASVELPPGASMVVFGGGSLTRFPHRPAAIAPGTLHLGNSGDSVQLFSPSGILIDTVTYQAAPGSVSLTRSPDLTGDWFSHGEVTGFARRASPGAWIDGTVFLTNQPPILTDVTNRNVAIGESLAFAVTAVEPDGHTIDLVATQLPANAAMPPVNAVGLAVGSFVFTPTTNQANQVFDVLFTATDTNGSHSQVSRITVGAVGLGVPVALPASGIDATQFTANWQAAFGATSYELDVATNAAFSGGAGVTTLIDFEGTGETKTGYASGTVTLSGLSWNLTEVLIGTLAADFKEGLRSARLRGYGTSAMTMLEDLTNGLESIAFQYRRYGTDTQVDWRVEISTNSAQSWFQVGADFTAPANDTVQTFSNRVDIAGPVRVRIKRATETGTVDRRLNIDNIRLARASGAPSFVPGYQARPVAGLSSVVTGLIEGVTYYYRVRAVRDAERSNHSETVAVTTARLGAEPVFLISGLHRHEGEDAGIVLRWESVPGGTYSIWWSTNLMTGFRLWMTNVTATADSMTIIDTVNKAESFGVYRIERE